MVRHRSKKLIDSMLAQIEKELKENDQTIKKVKITCTLPAHVHTYEKDEQGNYVTVCYSCKKII